MIVPTVPAGVPTLITWVKGGTTGLTVPVNRVYYLAWVGIRYTADANVADRTCYLLLTLVNTETTYLCKGSVTAGQLKRLSYNVNLSSATFPDDYTAGAGMLLPLYPGQQLGVTVSSGQAGDTWKAEGVYYEVPLSCP